MKLGEIVVHMDNYNCTKFHQNQMKNKKVLLIDRFSVQNFKVSLELWKSYIVRPANYAGTYFSHQNSLSTYMYVSISRASLPLKVTSGHSEQSCGKFWPLLESNHMRARAMPKSCHHSPTCGEKVVQPFCYQRLMDALEKFVTLWLNAGNATIRNGLHFERFIYFFNAKIWVLNPSAAMSLTTRHPMISDFVTFSISRVTTTFFAYQIILLVKKESDH